MLNYNFFHSWSGKTSPKDLTWEIWNDEAVFSRRKIQTNEVMTNALNNDCFLKTTFGLQLVLNWNSINIKLKVKVKVKSLSCVWLSATPWIVAHQALPSMGFSRQEYWSGLPFPSPGDLPDPGIEPRSPSLQADALPSESPGKSKYQVR